MKLRVWRTLLAVVGLGISVYLTFVHYDAHVPLVCTDNSFINCGRVITSPQSVVAGLPLAVWGILWFVVLGVAIGLRREPRSWSRVLDLGWAVVGALSVVYFIYIELFVVGVLCLWCSIVHLLVLANLFIAMGIGAPGTPAD